MKTQRTRRLAHPLCLAVLTLGASTAYGAEPLDWNKAGKASAWGTPSDTTLPRAGRDIANPAAGSRDGQAMTAKIVKGAGAGLFAMEDRSIVIVDGKSTTAGEVKRRINAELAAQAGPPKTVKVPARKLDLAALGATREAPTTKTMSGGPQFGENFFPVPKNRIESQSAVAGPSAGAKALDARSAQLSQVGSTSPSAAQAGLNTRTPLLKESIASTSKGQGIASARCLDKGPPAISEVQGKLKAGAKVTVFGSCFGDRPGRVEIIGQFPGGRLVTPFVAWDMTGVELQMPADIRGAGDHVVAISVVTADGKTSPAAQAKFFAARERIEVPPRLWQPGADFELASTTETLNTGTGVSRANPAAAGSVAKSLRLNPQCALDTMEAVVLSGGVTQIRGWEQGPPNEAQVSIDWVGTCTGTKTTTSYHYVIAQVGDDISITSACRVAFEARAWAWCPAGVAP